MVPFIGTSYIRKKIAGNDPLTTSNNSAHLQNQCLHGDILVLHLRHLAVQYYLIHLQACTHACMKVQYMLLDVLKCLKAGICIANSCLKFNMPQTAMVE